MNNSAPRTGCKTAAIPYIVIERALHAMSLTDAVILDEGWVHPGVGEGFAVVFPNVATFAAFAYHMGRFVDRDNQWVIKHEAGLLRSARITQTEAGIMVRFPGYHLGIGPRCRDLAAKVAAELGHQAPVAVQAGYTA